MRKIISLIISLLVFNSFYIMANAQKSSKGVYDLNGDKVKSVSVTVSGLKWKNDEEYTLLNEKNVPKIDIEPIINENAYDYEQVIIMDFKTDDEENPYPEIESMNVYIDYPQPSGGRRYLGKDFRLMHFYGDDITDLTESITTSSKSAIKFTTDKLGKYVIYLNPAAYDITFYLGEPIPTEEGNIIPDIYHEIHNLYENDIVIFPLIPEKEGYVFTGWKAWSGSGIHYVPTQPIQAVSYNDYYASWCPVDEYEPINIEISADKITKGKEDGKKVTLKTNYGVFVNDESFPSEWRDDYEMAETEEEKQDILSYWKESWNVIGSDELLIESAKRIDDKTVELTLSGNSSDKYSASDIYIEFDSSLLMPEPYEVNGEIIDWDDTKIKMDEDGVRAKMYRSDNAITLKKQNKLNSGGGGGGTRIPATVYAPVMQSTVVQDNRIIFTIGKMEASVFGEVVTNDVAPVIKDDRTFLPARFVAESLGAEVKWDEELKTVTITKDETEIVITIDSETATVNGETVTLDSPAFIENDRTYTPVRFVAEMLGAKVEWTEELRTVTITK